ncbi:hypothetical protein HDV02_005593, partial [Globomyces sp. JEL0801]
VLEQPTIFSIFVLRIMFHATFLICFVNLIVALMTVNVADVTSNMRAAWLVEISQLMVELEIYWPRPVRYSDERRLDDSEPTQASMLDLSVKSKPKRTNSTNSCFTLNEEEFYKEVEKIDVILYTAPRNLVMKSVWWTSSSKEDEAGNIYNKNREILKLQRGIDKNDVPSSPIPSPSVDIGTSDINNFYSQLGTKFMAEDSVKTNTLLNPTKDEPIKRRVSIFSGALVQEPVDIHNDEVVPWSEQPKRRQSLFKKDSAKIAFPVPNRRKSFMSNLSNGANESKINLRTSNKERDAVYNSQLSLDRDFDGQSVTIKLLAKFIRKEFKKHANHMEKMEQKIETLSKNQTMALENEALSCSKKMDTVLESLSSMMSSIKEEPASNDKMFGFLLKQNEKSNKKTHPEDETPMLEVLDDL